MKAAPNRFQQPVGAALLVIGDAVGSHDHNRSSLSMCPIYDRSPGPTPCGSALR